MLTETFMLANDRSFTVSLLDGASDTTMRERIVETFKGEEITHWDCQFPREWLGNVDNQRYFRDFVSSTKHKLENRGALFCHPMPRDVQDGREFFITLRDPKMNTAFTGRYQIAEPYEVGQHTQADGSGGVWCIVGDNLLELLEDLVRRIA